MARIVVLDAGPTGLASKPRGKADADRCRDWIRRMEGAGTRIVIPEIVEYEVRRELIRVGATAGLLRLERLASTLDYLPITTVAMRQAAEFWAAIRRVGRPTADTRSLDADCILAAQSWTLVNPEDTVTIATTNARHLARFPGITALAWDSIENPE